MQNLQSDLKTVFGKEPRETNDFLKLNLKKIQREELKKLSILELKHRKDIKNLEIKRSGTGLVIVIELN